MNNTATLKPHLQGSKLPSVDKLLDWRNQLVKLINNPEREVPKEWYEAEINATDYLLSLRK
jgi:hypothetical protein